MARELSREYRDYMKKRLESMPAEGPTPEQIAETRKNPPRPQLPGDLECEEVLLRGTRCIWTKTPGAPADKAVMYIHGGGFEYATAEASAQFTAEITRRSGINALAVEYRALPDHPYPVPLFDCAAAFLGLLDAGYLPENIVVTGESAGGCLTANLPMLLKAIGMPVPGAVAPLSCSFDNFGGSDFKGYTAFVDQKNPILSPLYGDLSGYPTTYISNGTEDLDQTFGAAAPAFCGALEKAGVACQLDVLDGLGHAPCLDFGNYPEADEALDLLVGFLKKALHVAEC